MSLALECQPVVLSRLRMIWAERNEQHPECFRSKSGSDTVERDKTDKARNATPPHQALEFSCTWSVKYYAKSLK